MKRFISLTAMVVALTISLHAEGLFEYNGMFPSDRPAEAMISNYMLLDKPRQVELEIVDSLGKPFSAVKVVEIVLTSDTSVRHASDSGITTVDLPEPGIYEVKVRPAEGAAGEIGFTLRVKDTGKLLPMPAAAPKAAPPAAAAPAPAPTVAKPKPRIVKNPPVVPPAPPVQPAPVATPAAPAASATSGTPVVPSAPAVPISPAATAVATVTTAVSPSPALEPPAVSLPPTVTAVDGNKPVMVLPARDGYADPFKPVEILFGKVIPDKTPLSACVKVFMLDAKGAEKAVDGQCFPAGLQGVRFIPAGLINGAVYHVRANDHETGQRLADFSFPTFPEVRLTMARGSEGEIRLEITWPPLPELMPSAEGQVIRLDMTELVVTSAGEEIISFAMKPEMPPFGSVNGIDYRAQPWRFTMTIPQAKVNPAAGQLEATLRVILAGAEKPLDVVKSTLSFSGPTQTAAFGTSMQPVPEEQPKIASAPAAEAAVATMSASEVATAAGPVGQTASAVMPGETPAAAVASQPAGTWQPAAEQFTLTPVVPCEDPGATASMIILRKFAVGEGGPNDAFSWPKGLTWAADGTLWVVDSQNRRLLRFLDDGRLVTAMGKKGRGPGMLGLPIDIDIATSGIIVSDTSAHTLHHFDVDGNFLRAIGEWGTKSGQLDLPHGVFIDGDQIWVTDRGNTKIMRFGFDGKYRGGFGKKGELDGYISEPVGIRIYGDTVWILEGKNGRIQRFSRDGKSLGSFKSGAKDPVALEIDPWGYPWVADGEGHRIMRFDQNGRLLLTIQPPPSGRQWIPTSVAIRADGVIAVGDGEDRSIHLYRIRKP